MSQSPVAGSPLQWDMAGARTQDCDIVSTVGGGHTITFNFGQTVTSGGALTVGLRRRIVVPPLSAKHLRDALQNLLAAANAKTEPGQ